MLTILYKISYQIYIMGSGFVGTRKEEKKTSFGIKDPDIRVVLMDLGKQTEDIT